MSGILKLLSFVCILPAVSSHALAVEKMRVDGCEVLTYTPDITRWSCPDGKSTALEMPAAGKLTLEPGTSLIKFKDQVYVYSGSAITKKGNTLNNRILYFGRSTGWGRVKPQPTSTEIKNWDSIYPLSAPPVTEQPIQTPIQAKEIKEMKRAPDKPTLHAEPRKTTDTRGPRVMVSGYYGYTNIQNAQSEFTSLGSTNRGIRGWLNPSGEPHSRLFTLDLLSTENPNSNAANGTSQVEGVLGGWGPRYKHSDNFGFYGLFHTGIIYNKIEKNYGSYSVRRDRMYIPVGLSLGAQMILLPDIFRLLTAVEVSVIYGFNYIDQVQSDAGTLPAGYKIRGSPLIYGINIHLGPAFQF